MGGQREERWDRGLNLSRLDVTTDQEIEDFRSEYIATKGKALPAFEFWFEHRPEVLKRHRLQAAVAGSATTEEFPAICSMFFLQLYVVQAYEEGIRYEANLAKVHGVSHQGVLDCLALSFMHGGPRGMSAVASSVGEYLRDPAAFASDSRAAFPPRWHFDAAALAVGLDYGTPELLPGEAQRIRAWYEEHAGGLPAFLDFLLTARPRLGKAYQGRFEATCTGALPVELIPLLLVHLNVSMNRPSVLPDYVRMARALGCAREDVLDAIAWGLIYGNAGAMASVAQVAQGLLDQWTEGRS